MAKKQTDRTCASQQYAKLLDKLADSAAMRIHVAGQNINVPLPQGSEFKKIAAHMRFLELCVTGISHNERRTIAKLTRRVSTLERMVQTREAKIRKHKQDMSQLKTEYEAYAKHMQEKFERDLAKAKKITPEQAHEIEKNFIKNLQTSYEIQQREAKAKIKGMKEGMAGSYAIYDSARNDNRYYR
jgi:chromosome segregation ATPase